ncbi:uncharacterized protein LOC134747402 [Cydia strobilella]|uniref:uncharacterized protein LOC134747402 n=1 Tax=Cydia strobilella TaxID=1100964 RepID=UPI00300675CE
MTIPACLLSIAFVASYTVIALQFNKVVKDKKKLKVVKELLRIVTITPIEVKAFGGIDVNMTLIPTCLAVVGCYCRSSPVQQCRIKRGDVRATQRDDVLREEVRIVTLARVISFMRIHIECNFIYYIFHTLSEQLQCIIRSAIRSKLYYCENSDEMINLEKWRQYYTNVKKSKELFDEIYGIQILINLDQKKLRTVKRLLRIVSSRPIKVKTFGSIDINMTLVPACLTLVASYTVILLQFNNVV